MTCKPTWEPLWLRCKECHHEWDDWQPCHVPIRVWTTHIRLIRCPNCGRGSRALLMRTTPLKVGFAE